MKQNETKPAVGRLWGRKVLREMGRRGQQWPVTSSLGQESDFTVTVMRFYCRCDEMVAGLQWGMDEM